MEPEEGNAVQTTASDKIDKNVCEICQDKAAGYHFGMYTCEGCKSFFSRNYKRAYLIQPCRLNGACSVVGSRNRVACKFCRFKTMLEKGMARDRTMFGRRSDEKERESRTKRKSVILLPSMCQESASRSAVRAIKPRRAHSDNSAAMHRRNFIRAAELMSSTQQQQRRPSDNKENAVPGTSSSSAACLSRSPNMPLKKRRRMLTAGSDGAQSSIASVSPPSVIQPRPIAIKPTGQAQLQPIVQTVAAPSTLASLATLASAQENVQQAFYISQGNLALMTGSWWLQWQAGLLPSSVTTSNDNNNVQEDPGDFPQEVALNLSLNDTTDSGGEQTRPLDLSVNRA